jgi:hypothetical protein
VHKLEVDSGDVLAPTYAARFSRDMVELLCEDIHSAFGALSREAGEGSRQPRTRRRPHC